ncbi:MAG: ketoacyl-ACP synthase III [Acidobacteria bacterium]|uniref:Beta-ketoacyl-[acyl-carrier-protein] synthase III n=1 Tax=Candidatus Polarisedimenticola svalbardensis TaxID=2886004 RepID=A0A8J6Y325_9BACT|nr:ketoacyl-ACP synthase III [Candidatus Polarisedimenticola svalbardensis]
MSFPEKRLTNADLEKMVETNNEWIVERTGIKERRIVEKGTPASVHGAKAAQQAMEHAGITPMDVDLIIVPTVTPDMMFPATACLIQEMIGAKNAWGFDLEGACSGFIFALQNARAQIEAGHAKRVLVIGTEVMSSIVDYTDRNTCILFGDGSGAVVVERIDEARGGIIDAINRTDGTGARFLYMKGGGSLNPSTPETISEGMHYIRQEGRDVFKFAVKGMAGITAEIVEKNGLTGADVDLFVPHQANIRIIEAAQRRVGLEDSQVCITIDRFGNTTSASIPSALRVALDEGRLKEGSLVVLCAFGAGFTWGSTLLRWTAP